LPATASIRAIISTVRRTTRKRRAAIGALALLEWRERTVRQNTEAARLMRYHLMLQAMRVQAEEVRAPEGCLISVGLPVCHGTGHAGAI
jgi:hypothetical protein